MTSTFAGDRPSMRYRDLVDIVLIAQSQTVDATELRVAVESECHSRGHSLPLPLQLTLPDETWKNGTQQSLGPCRTSVSNPLTMR